MITTISVEMDKNMLMKKLPKYIFKTLSEHDLDLILNYYNSINKNIKFYKDLFKNWHKAYSWKDIYKTLFPLFIVNSEATDNTDYKELVTTKILFHYIETETYILFQFNKNKTN